MFVRKARSCLRRVCGIEPSKKKNTKTGRYQTSGAVHGLSSGTGSRVIRNPQKRFVFSNLTVSSCEPCPKRWFIWKLNKNKYGPEGLSAAAVRLLPLGVTNRTRMTLFGGGRWGASLLNVSKQVVKHLTGRLKTSFMHFKSALSQSINIARTNRTERTILNGLE